MIRRLSPWPVVLVLLMACAGNLPKIPNTPEAILARGDQYFDRGKQFQASELFKAFVERYPGHDRSDYAQYRLAESYFQDQQYELAAVEYRVIVSRYGYSEYVDNALFMVGVSYWELRPAVHKDPQRVLDALNMFRQFVQTFPSSPLLPEATEYIRRSHAFLAEKSMISARWYFKRKRYRSALIYCDKVIDKYPENEFWAEALYYKGLIKLRMGEKDEAIRYFMQVIDYPEDLGVKHWARTMIEEARE